MFYMGNLTNSARLIAEMNKKANTSSLAKVATTNKYSDLDGTPTIPTVNNTTITIQKNGADVDSFTTNASTAKKINIALTKSDVWLWNVDNTSDANKPISNATQTALNAKANTDDVYTKPQVDAAISAALGSVYKYKGSVDSYSKLPSTGLTAWDVYNVVASYGSYPAGTNWAWTGTEWDALGGTVDLSNYVTNSILTTELNKKQNSLATQTAYSAKGTATKVPQITTNNLWQVTNITEVTITQPDISGKADTSAVLTKTNTISYTPSADYHPATKKYVDDAVSSAGGGNVIAMAQSEYDALDDDTKNDWKLRIITDAPAVTFPEIIYCTQAEYDALPDTKTSDGNHYMIYE